MAEVKSWARHCVRSTGIACLVGVLFLLQELLRTLLDVAELESRSSAGFGSAGWLDMSGAATPAAWLYLAGHVWVFLFGIRWRSWPNIGATDWTVCGLLTIGIMAVQVIVLGPLRDWIIRPRLL
jgi:hypothetical protein